MRVASLERGDRIVAHGDNLAGGRMGRSLGDQHREQHGLEQDEGLDPTRRGECRRERHRASIGMANEMKSLTGRRKDRTEQRHLVGERQRPGLLPQP